MNVKIKILNGDITKLTCDVIVNAANKYLVPGGGVDGAIHSVGGAAILEGCRNYISRYEVLQTGHVMITDSGRLAAKAVIHTVGPRIEGNLTLADEKLLRACYLNALELAVEEGYRSIAFPNISTGIYGFPKLEASIYAFDEVFKFLGQCDFIDCVYFVCHDKENYQFYMELWEAYFERT